MRASRPNPVELGRRAGLRGVPGLLRTEPFSTLWGSLARTFDDPRLRQLFARYATYCGSSPFKAPATLMLIAHVERAGVWLVDGGMQTLANTLAARCEALGAACRYGDGVARIETTGGGRSGGRWGGGRISGVTLESGETLAAEAVVFNGDTAALSGRAARRGPCAARRRRARRRRCRPSRAARWRACRAIRSPITRCSSAATTRTSSTRCSRGAR